MDTKNLKAYAPQARRDFIAAVTKRAAQFGLYEDRIADVVIEGSSAIIEGRVFTRKQAMQRGQLAKRIDELGFNQFINEAAFTWVNRLTAIRYMEVNGYLEHGFRILSMPPKKDAADNEVTAKFGEGFEILAHAADVAEHLELDKSSIVKMLLAGDKEEELYREILLGECHQLSKVMPFMFEKLNDATELLLPDNLTKTDSILKELVDKIPETDWQDIEVIGWLYQFYISEHKDAVIGKVVKKEDIPAATQLFTPNWIVKYLVQNSLGRQWLETYPKSDLKDKMEYYIVPAEQSDDVIEQLKIITPSSIDPETIKVLDPACGSGHILVEVYDVLREIYLERGYRLREIPELILTKNIYGLDIDDRAAQMAAFAVLMKAREDDRRIFDRIASNDIKLNIYSIQSTEHLDINQLWADLDLEGKHQTGSTSGLFEQNIDKVFSDLETNPEYTIYLELLRYLKVQFIDAKNIGSLIDIDNKYVEELVKLHDKLLFIGNASNTVSTPAAKKLLPIVEQAIVISNRYDSVIANPPYMGGNGMNPDIKKYAKKVFPNSKHDLFTMYIERCLNYGNDDSQIALVTPFVWMFISSYEGLRESVLRESTLNTLVQLEYNAFEPACIPVCAYTFNKKHITDYVSSFIKLSEFKGHQNQAPKTIEAIKNRDCGWLYEASPDDFTKIPGSPISFWAGNEIINLLGKNESIGNEFPVKSGIMTGDDTQYLRVWHEVSLTKLGLDHKSFKEMSLKWFPLSKGGSFRKWYGNIGHVIDLENDGYSIKNGGKNYRLRNKELYFQPYITWSRISSGQISFRYIPNGALFADAAPGIFAGDKCVNTIAVLNSEVGTYCLNLLNPTLNYQTFDVERLPYFNSNVTEIAQKCISISKEDWDSYEGSIDFKISPLLKYSGKRLDNTYSALVKNIEVNVTELQTCEETINKEFINQFELQGILESGIDIEKVSLTSNKYYRYGNKELNYDGRLRSDVFVELISYCLGCMMGRYSLDFEGLVYANFNNEGFNELLKGSVYSTFPADDDGIIPLASEAWLFEDDATVRFREFVKTVWGEEHLQENLDFIAESLCLNAVKPKNSEGSLDTIRRYLSSQFYKDHLQTYKKRPIYWLFSSGKEKAFECLVYLHRYNEGTLSRMRTEYVTPLMGKFESQTSILRDERDSASSSEQRRIDKELKSIEKKQAELRTFDEELKHISEMKISLDLDDGVKVNYGKFGNLLANVKDVHGKKPEVVK